MNVDVWEFAELVHIIEDFKAFKRAMESFVKRKTRV
jgi:hypothetical protein